MDIGSRIKTRRKQLNMTADTLGEAIGKNRSTIYRYETGEIENMPVTLIPLLAEALRTTPAYLMCWEDNPEYGEEFNTTK